MNCSIFKPLNYTDIKYQLDINDLGKKNYPETILKANALCILHEQYSKPEWTRIYTDGSEIQALHKLKYILRIKKSYLYA